MGCAGMLACVGHASGAGAVHSGSGRQSSHKHDISSCPTRLSKDIWPPVGNGFIGLILVTVGRGMVGIALAIEDVVALLNACIGSGSASGCTDIGGNGSIFGVVSLKKPGAPR